MPCLVGAHPGHNRRPSCQNPKLLLFFSAVPSEGTRVAEASQAWVPWWPVGTDRLPPFPTRKNLMLCSSRNRNFLASVPSDEVIFRGRLYKRSCSILLYP